MYAIVEESECIGCGSCEAVCPSIFKLNDDGKAEAYAEVDEATKAECQEAINMCPMHCITLEDE